MHLRLGRFKAVALLAGVLCGMLSAPVRAQGRAQAPVIVAIPEEFPAAPARPGSEPQEVSALVYRYPSGTGARDVILLKAESATPAVLSVALEALERHRTLRPVVEGNGVLTIPAARHLPRIDQSRGARLAERLARIRERRPSHLDRVGNARWIEISPGEER